MFHAGTARADNGDLIAVGGRVLACWCSITSVSVLIVMLVGEANLAVASQGRDTSCGGLVREVLHGVAHVQTQMLGNAFCMKSQINS